MVLMCTLVMNANNYCIEYELAMDVLDTYYLDFCTGVGCICGMYIPFVTDDRFNSEGFDIARSRNVRASDPQAEGCKVCLIISRVIQEDKRIFP